MTQYSKQTGSSTTGLLSATTIFVALIAYANFYGFKKQTVEVSDDNSSGQTQQQLTKSSAVDATVKIAATPDVVQAEEMKPATAVVNEKTQTPEDKIVTESSQQLSSPAVNHSEPSIASNLPAQSVYSPLADVSMNRRYKIYSGGQNQIGSKVSQTNQYGQYINAYSMAHNRNRSEYKGDGRFDFSMNFSARSKMNADTQLDSRLDSSGVYYGNHAMTVQNRNNNLFYTTYHQ